jgi:hypothetical protein
MKQMKNILFVILVAFGLNASAQQVNPVPDYTFANRMSAGRNTVTDTAAYFSIGPRYGAIRGMMPPMVVDTASVSGNKRNGLLIFSVQKNKFVYWDSVGSKWAEMAGTGGSAITGSGVAGYMPEFTTATNLDSTNLYHSAGRFAIGSTTTSNGRFSVFGGQSYFDTSLKVGSQTLLADEGKNEVYVNTTSDAGAFALQVGGSIYNTTGATLAASSGNVGIGGTPTSKFHIFGGSTPQFGATALINADIETNNSVYNGTLSLQNTTSADGDAALTFGVYGHAIIRSRNETTSFGGALDFYTRPSNAGTPVERMTISTTGYIGMGTTNPQEVLHVAGNQRITGDYLQGYGSAGSYKMEIGTGRTGNGSAFIDLVGDATYTDFGLRLVRNNGGANTSSSLAHRGTGELNIYNYEQAPIIFVINSVEVGRWGTGGELLLNNAGTDVGDYKLQVTGAIYNTTTITTGAPTSGTAKPWKLGEAATVSPTSPNRTIRVEIDGTVYYLHAKTTND